MVEITLLMNRSSNRLQRGRSRKTFWYVCAFESVLSNDDIPRASHVVYCSVVDKNHSERTAYGPFDDDGFRKISLRCMQSFRDDGSDEAIGKS
ncbi:hypothetical protein Y032_0009g722 [Ancylostoma ceylanicum]|uniref:Uncharacterized protein n=1 Tax=Ancylostoma ceylanicum TaxID=53326 RepID=A0A016VJ34_9BILA|nr:hypothetical protein Y032_0009g722 [Ancylostoma ceylanicum]